LKKLIGALTLLGTLLFASPAFAYTVSKGDTMSKIAQDHGISLQQLAAANPQINNLDLIIIGQTIHLEKGEHTRESINNADSVKQAQLTTNRKPIQSAKAKKVGYKKKGAPGKTRTEGKKTEHTRKLGLSDAEIDLLARIVRAEAQSESFEGKVAVAGVVLNRVDSPKFPDTVKGVIYAPGQFQPVKNGQINKPADKESIKAVHTALANKGDAVNGALFFYNPAIATNRWLDSRPTTVVIGNHVFKR
jgi:N-acetylmuramoyl-L-alanine amidase